MATTSRGRPRPLDQPDHGPDGRKVRRDDLSPTDPDGGFLREESDQIEERRRVDDIELEERRVVIEPIPVSAQVLADDVLSDSLCEGHEDRLLPSFITGPPPTTTDRAGAGRAGTRSPDTRAGRRRTPGPKGHA